jgi:hypothetical protein
LFSLFDDLFAGARQTLMAKAWNKVSSHFVSSFW